MFTAEYRARWSDMDFNQHMANTEFLSYAEQTRMLFLEDRGWSMARFAELQIGPVVVEDRLTYKREIRMLERFTVTQRLAAGTPDLRRMLVRNEFLVGERLTATVDSVVLWFNLAVRRPVVPPDTLRDAWASLGRTEDYVDWD